MRKCLHFPPMAAIALIAATLGLASCGLIPFKQGRLEIVVSTVQAKTIVPVLAPSLYHISFSGPTAQSAITTASAMTTVSLTTGTWDVVVEGLDSGGRIIAKGDATGLLVSSGSTTTAAIKLFAVTSGSGTIDVTVTWPSLSPPITAWKAVLDGIDKGTTTVPSSSYQLHYSESCASGNFRLLIQLLSGTDNKTVRASLYEAVQVYDNLTSSASIALVESDFTKVPEAPSGLTVTAASNGLALSWTDNSKVETSYEIQRSNNGADWPSSPTATISTPATGYTDTAAASGQTYYYRVRALNDIGYSPYSNTASGSWAPSSSLSLTVTVVSPTDATITFNHADDIVVAQTDTIAVSITEAFVTYEWALDGINLAGKTGNTLSLSCATLKPGVHHLTAFVTRDSCLYSKSMRFLVSN